MLAGADTVLTIGVEVQNTMKAIYGADVLAGAGWYKNVKRATPIFFLTNSVNVLVLISINMEKIILAKGFRAGMLMQ